MCGISVEWPQKNKKPNPLVRMRHRGLYETRKRMDPPGIVLGHRRLPIQGLSPEFSCPYLIGENYYLLNGEIFNYKELKPLAKSDVQVLDLDPRFFDGDFAIVCYKPNREITVVTDRFGKRQLYYRLEGGKITGIASEIKALVQDQDQLDMQYLSTVAKFGYVFGQDLTLVQNIKKFMPGKEYHISFQGQITGVKEIRWDSHLLVPKEMRCDKENLSPHQRFEKLMKLSFQRRMISDVPISLLFSGGLDSSIVLYHMREAIAAKQLKDEKSLEVFSLQNLDDLDHARKLTSEWGIKLRELPEENTLDLDEERVRAHNELVADLGSWGPNSHLFHDVAKAGYKVCMTGDAADEVFSGYKRNLGFDFQENDILNELVYYHFPRLDLSAMMSTVEYRSPFSADYIIDFARTLTWEQRKNKNFLRTHYSGRLPRYILDREKTALKSQEIREDKQKVWIENATFWKSGGFEVLKRSNLW